VGVPVMAIAVLVSFGCQAPRTLSSETCSETIKKLYHSRSSGDKFHFQAFTAVVQKKSGTVVPESERIESINSCDSMTTDIEISLVV